MHYYMTEGEALYQDRNHGQFSLALASWAISQMKVKDKTTGRLKKLEAHSLEEMEEVLRRHGITIPEECIYTAWYLYNMCYADYRRSLPTEEVIAAHIDETLCDVDSCPEAVLACFCAKMDAMCRPIYWERML